MDERRDDLGAGMAVRSGHMSLQVETLLGRRLNDVESKYAPSVLHCAGSMDLPFATARISVIGSRRASDRGLREARRIARFLAKSSVTVVSGLARGIDTAAHKAAMECGGRTIAVIGTPLDRAYPKDNAGLQQAIMRHHLVVSQYQIGRPTRPKDFVLRNRTMALISDGTVVVEAGESSGTLHQCWETLRLGRPLFIGRVVLENDSLKWPRKMMEYGAMELGSLKNIMENVPASIATPPLFQ